MYTSKHNIRSLSTLWTDSQRVSLYQSAQRTTRTREIYIRARILSVCLAQCPSIYIYVYIYSFIYCCRHLYPHLPLYINIYILPFIIYIYPTIYYIHIWIYIIHCVDIYSQFSPTFPWYSLLFCTCIYNVYSIYVIYTRRYVQVHIIYFFV